MTGLRCTSSMLPAPLFALTLASLLSSSALSAQWSPVPSGPQVTGPLLVSKAANPNAAWEAPLPAFSSSTAIEAASEPSAILPADAPYPVSSINSYATGGLSRQVRPFSALAIAVKLGVAGIGLDLATPLAQRFNLRVGGSFFQYTDTESVDGTTINGDLKFRSVTTSLDWYPFNNRFRISPGVTLYNGNNLNATAMVPGGQTFQLNDDTYTSSPTDPIHGSATFFFGKRTAPSLTIGAGNMIPRHGDGHFSIPFEIGFQYISDPMLTLALAGSACSQGICQSTQSNPDFQANLQAENVELNNDIRPLRFYPILSIGLGYRF